MKKRAVKLIAFVLSICAVLPALAAMAHVERGTDRKINSGKDEYANRIEARKDTPASPIEARKDEPANPIE